MTSQILRAVIVAVLFVIGWAGAALAGENCDKFPTAPGTLWIVDDEPQLLDAVGDPDGPGTSPTAAPGDFICIQADITLTAGNDPSTNGVNITVPGITIYGAIEPAGTRTTVTGAGVGLPVFTVSAINVTITDPIIDCAGGTAGVIVMPGGTPPGGNFAVIELNTIGGLTGPCTIAGVLVRADHDTDNDQARDDTDGDGVLEDTVGVRIRANTFDAQVGDSGPAIWLEENVVGVGDPNVGALEDQPPFEQCTGATAGSNHTVIGSSSANATIAPSGPIVGNGAGSDDGNLITSTTGAAGADWEDGIRSEGSHICIRGNVVQTISTAAQPAIDDNGIQLDPGANGTAVWGNIIGSLDTTVPPLQPAVDGDGIAVLGPFKLTAVTPDGDSLYDNIVGNVGTATQAALRGAGDDGFVCQDERIFIQGSSQGAQRAVDNGDDGFDLTNADGDSEGFGCTKRDAVFNNDAISNGGNGFEGGSDFVDNDAHGNGGDGFFVPGTAAFPQHRFCGNVASQNSFDGFDVDDNNLFTNAGTFGSATCARGGNRALANINDGFELGGGNVFEPATVSGAPSIAGSPVHFAWCNGGDGVNMGTGGGDSNRIRRVSAINNENNGFLTPGGSDDNHLSNNIAGNLAGTGDATPTACTPAGHPATAPALTGMMPVTFGDQDDGWENGGGTAASPNRAWRNTFGDPDFENSSTLGSAFTGNAGNGVNITGGSVILEESSGSAGATAAADLDGNGTPGEACNVITNNTLRGLYNNAAGGSQQIDDFDGQGGTRLSNIYEQRDTTPDQVDIEHDGTGTLKAEGLWTLLTVGPTPDIDVGPSSGTVQVSSTRVHSLTTVSALLADCAVGTSGGGTPAPSNVVGDANLNSSFEQGDLDLVRQALRREVTLTNEQLARADVARPCGRLTRADYNRLRTSLIRINRGRPALASQCGSRGIIGQPASAPRLLLNVLTGASAVRVNVYDISGRLLFEQKASAAQMALDLAQHRLANGVYLAVVETLAADGRTLSREVRKFVVLR